MDTLLQQGLELMLVGMGVVFAFLGMLVWVTNITSSLVQRLAPEVPVPPPAAAPAAVAAAVTPRQLAAIRAAVAQYRARHK